MREVFPHPRALKFLPKCFYTNSHTFQGAAKIFEKKNVFSIHPVVNLMHAFDRARERGLVVFVVLILSQVKTG